MKIKIFYSWQSFDTKHNKNFISDCIKAAVKKTKQNPDFKNIEFEVTDAIRNEVGQVAVADTIIDKIIPDCDIFIADLTGNPINKFIRLLTNNKPAPNPNVMTEYGVALDSLGKQRIISVLNTYNNGSPKDNAEIIPFDLRHDRFPTEYNYSKKNENQKSDIKKKFTADLVDIFKPTIQNVLETQKSKYRPFIGWNELNDLLKNPKADKFIESDKYLDIKLNIINPTNSSPIRILGLSGLGKTRIVLEVFRPQNNDNDSLIFSNRLLYVNCNDYQEKINFVELISKINKEKKDAILIVDNCDLETHRIISRNLKELTFISIDSNPEENINTEGTNYIIIGKNDFQNVVTQLVDNDFQNVGKENIEKIKEFSQGIPLMAVLLVDSINKGEKFLGKLDDKELLDKLLGSKGKEQEWRNILKSCSMFSYIGYDKDVDIQYQFIATNENITISNNTQQVRISTFLDVVKHFREREIFEKQGRFLSIRPLPLAMALAVEWLDSCNSERLLQVIIDISKLEEPHRKQLINSLSEQMKYLGYNDKALEIVEKTTGPNSPFDNAEVLNTELGSRLFRSFVEVNPEAISKNLTRLFSLKSKEELINVKEGRRNLVWVLEKLCFDKRTFSESIKILYSFAVAENETWSNNATGQFLQLFNVHLAGTEVDLVERWKIIEWGLNQKEAEYRNLALRAMSVGLGFGHATRIIGAEDQGTKRLKDYEPPNFEVIIVYWNCILEKLYEIIQNKEDGYETASKTIANKLRDICRAGYSDVIFPFIEKIIKLKNNDWDFGLECLKQVSKYDSKFLSTSQKKKLEEFINALTKTDFNSRYIYLSKAYHLDEDESFSSDKVIHALEKLADEFINSDLEWTSYFPTFYSNQQVFSYHFGKRIYELLKKDNKKVAEFINLSQITIESIEKEKRDVSVLGGFINEADKTIQEDFLKSIKNSCLDYLLFYFIPLNPDGKLYFDLLFALVDDKKLEVSNFRAISRGRALDNMNLKELESFAERMFLYEEEGYSIVFDLYFNIGYHNKDLRNSLIPIFEKCIRALGMNRKHIGQLDGYRWSEIVCLIISDTNKKEFAKYINTAIIDSISFKNSYHLDTYVQKIYEHLLKIHFDSIWPDLSKSLLSVEEAYEKFYGLKHILGSRIGGVGRSIGVLFVGNIDKIFDWCKNKSPLAPARLAELVPIFNNDNQDYSEWHPITLRLIDEFGQYEDVLRNLSSNMGTFSWSGSLVPLLESKKRLFSKIKNHKINEVTIWANKYLQYIDEDIERERNRDEEMFL